MINPLFVRCHSIPMYNASVRSMLCMYDVQNIYYKASDVISQMKGIALMNSINRIIVLLLKSTYYLSKLH